MVQKKKMPMVSVCTPTFNRRPFIPIMFECFRNQDYPKSRIEWIIVDDGTDKIKDLVEAANIPQIKYIEVPNKMKLGEKRNYMHTFAKGSIIVYMDDDDYYPPERISHAVQKLSENKNALCAGSSEIYVYFKHIHKMYQAGPYGEKHATAGTFAFRRELLDITRYEDGASLAEERSFLKNYTIPFVQLDPMKSILVFSHDQNTFDKRKLLNQGQNNFFKESSKTVDMFIRNVDEQNIKQFFMTDIGPLLKKYSPGDPSMKPDVLAQIKEIEASQQKMANDANQNGNAPLNIMFQEEGKAPRQLTCNEVVELLESQRQQNAMLSQRVQGLEQTVVRLQTQLLNKTKNEFSSTNLDLSALTQNIPIVRPETISNSKTMPEVIINI